MSEKVVIIGSGPAAWTAAIYAARANLQPLVIEGAVNEDNRLAGTLPGGQLSLTTEVENFPGFPDGVDGPTLIQRMKIQAAKYGTRVISEDVFSVERTEDGDFGVHYSNQPDHNWGLDARTVIVATGASAKYLDAPGVEEFKNRGVSACAVCDGALPRFRGKPVVVVGGGDSACEEANYLSKFASEVHLFVRNKMRASKVMRDRVFNNPKIHVWPGMSIYEVEGDAENGVTSVYYDYTVNGTGEIESESSPSDWLDASGVFCAIGHKPNTSFLTMGTDPDVCREDELVLVDEDGFIVTGADPYYSTMTTIDGLFAAGDVADPRYKQAITAAGEGCKAALDAERYLAQRGVH